MDSQCWLTEHCERAKAEEISLSWCLCGSLGCRVSQFVTGQKRQLQQRMSFSTVRLKGETEIEAEDVGPAFEHTSVAVLFRGKRERTLHLLKSGTCSTQLYTKKNTILYNSFTSAGPNCILPFRQSRTIRVFKTVSQRSPPSSLLRGSTSRLG